MTQPHKFLHRLRQQQFQQKQQKLVLEAQEKSLILREQISTSSRPLAITTPDKNYDSILDNSPETPYSFATGKSRRKKHVRRSAVEIDRSFVCPYDGCDKFFGSEGSQNLHIKIKHNGGTKTDREKLAR